MSSEATATINIAGKTYKLVPVDEPMVISVNKPFVVGSVVSQPDYEHPYLIVQVAAGLAKLVSLKDGNRLTDRASKIGPYYTLTDLYCMSDQKFITLARSPADYYATRFLNK